MALVDRSHATTLIQATEADLQSAMAGADGLGRLDLEIEGEKGQRKVIVRQVDKDFMRQQILHVTLAEVTESDVVKMDIRVVSVGVPEDLETMDLQLSHPTDHVTLRGKMSAMPEVLEVDVSQLHVGHHVSAGDLQLPPGIELLSSADATLFSLTQVKEQVLEPEAAPAEPVEIGAEEKEEGG